jgi:polar amino acid transport system substrate-binding protein
MKRLLACLLCGLVLRAWAGEQLEVLAHSLDGAAELKHGQLQPQPGGGMRAFSLALTQRLLASQPRPFTVREVPLNRGMQLLATPLPVLLVGTFRTPEREAHYRWIGPLLSVDTLLYQDRHRPVAATSLAAAVALPVCAVRGGSVQERLRLLGFTDIEQAASYAICLRMLAAGRVRLAAVVSGDFAQRLHEAGLRPGHIQPSGLVVLSADSYIAASLALPADEVASLNRSLAALRASPEYTQLRQRYWP